LQYQEIKVGTGAAAEPQKLLKFHFTLWIAADGTKFDSSYDHPGPPLKDKDGKPVMGDDGKPKLDKPQPWPSIMGQGRPLPGWDMGSVGMKAGGKRRVFIPWQLGFGDRDIPAHGVSQPAIPARSDLILDLDLVEVADAPQASHPGMPPNHPPIPGMHPVPGGAPHPGAPTAPPVQSAPGAPPNPSAPGAAPSAPTTAAPAPAAAPNAAPAPATSPKPASPAAPANASATPQPK
jgi:peptidylprolyl isomerase